ncbi:uncharacterized protein V1477_021290 [Vespula maculifrons]|uniref:Uncharacterized protein n=1 Tax=Vespula maculifrons TaxID=7453 RepID=A0ABD2AHD9_VESMC
MDVMRLRKYYRYNAFGFDKMLYGLLIAENDLRTFLNLGLYSGPITIFIFILLVILISCTFTNSSVLTANERVLGESRNDIEKRIPRRESVIDLRPAYKCIYKHLQQTEVFQRKTKKLLRKELLEVEIMNSKITCLEKLLRPEEQCDWRQSRSPRVYHRAIGVTSK